MKITDPSFKWISSATHDADSTLFRERQRARIAEAAKKRQEDTKNVKPILRRKEA